MKILTLACALIFSSSLLATMDSYVSFYYPSFSIHGPSWVCINTKGVAIDKIGTLDGVVGTQVKAIFSTQNITSGSDNSSDNSSGDAPVNINALSNFASKISYSVGEPGTGPVAYDVVRIYLTISSPIDADSEELIYYTILKSALIYTKKVFITVEGASKVLSSTKWPYTKNSNLYKSMETKMKAKYPDFHTDCL